MVCVAYLTEAELMLVLKYESDKTNMNFAIYKNMNIKNDCYCYIKSNDSLFQRSSNMQTVYKVISSIQ